MSIHLYKLSTSFSVINDNEATIVQTGSSGLSLGSSVGFFSKTGRLCMHFVLVLRKGRLVMSAISSQYFFFV